MEKILVPMKQKPTDLQSTPQTMTGFKNKTLFKMKLPMAKTNSWILLGKNSKTLI